MTKRKPISKKTRFEVFKRDGFQCAYCGESPPRVVLEIDHIEPVSKGGSDSISNLIAACFDCNRGKRNTLLDKIPSKLSEQTEVLKQKEEQLSEYRKFVNKIQKIEQSDINKIANIYKSNVNDYELKETFKQTSLKNFLKKLPFNEVSEAMFIALDKTYLDEEEKIKYFCGVCWGKIKDGRRDNK